MFSWNFNKSTYLLSERPGMLYGISHQGIVFWNLTRPGKPVPAVQFLNDDPEDRTGLCYVTGSGSSWRLYVTNFVSQVKQSGLEVWQVDEHADPKDCLLLGRYDGDGLQARGNYADVVAVDAGQGHQMAYVTFGPTDNMVDGDSKEWT
jgi:hypothetical protein